MTDRRFGSPRKFGTSTTFGASTLNGRLLWGIEFDWDGDGIFDGNEARYLKSVRTARGRTGFVANNGVGFEKLQTGSCTVVLENIDGRFDAWNVNSPLYPNVNYGKKARITVTDISTGTTYPVFFGYTQDLEPHYKPSTGENYVTITIADLWAYLRNYNANYSIQTDITPGTAISAVLDSIGWTWGKDIDAGSDVIRYWWASGDKTAGSVIEDIAESFLGYFYTAADGTAVYRTRSNIPSATVLLDQADLLKDISIPQPWKNGRNVTRIKTHPRTAAATGVIYQLVGEAPLVQDGAGNALTLFGDYTYEGTVTPANNIVTPVATTDYTMNTQSDGGGVDKTADCTVTLTDFGDRCKLVIRNTSGGNVYITKLQVRGDALYEPNVSDVVYPSVTPQMPRQFTLDLIWQQDVNVAVDFSNVIGPFLEASHPFPIVQIENRPELQFPPDLFDIVSLTSDKFGILGESYRVAYIEHSTLHGNCQAVLTKFYLEPYIYGGDYWTWDTASVFDTSTIFGA